MKDLIKKIKLISVNDDFQFDLLRAVINSMDNGGNTTSLSTYLKSDLKRKMKCLEKLGIEYKVRKSKRFKHTRFTTRLVDFWVIDIRF